MLREAIQKLPAPYRIVLVLRDMEGLTDEDVAEITGLRAGTVRVRLHRARLFVRKELMKAWKPRAGRNTRALVPQGASADEPKPARCKAMFAGQIREKDIDWLLQSDVVLCCRGPHRRGRRGAAMRNSCLFR